MANTPKHRLIQIEDRCYFYKKLYIHETISEDGISKYLENIDERNILKNEKTTGEYWKG